MYIFQHTCRIQFDALASGNALVPVDPRILHGMEQVSKTVTVGQGSALVWPALLRKLERMDPGYKE